MIKSILCAVDINEPDIDDKVLAMAARLAGLDNAQLDVVTVVPDYGMSLVGSFFEASHTEQALEEASRRLHKLVENTVGAEQAGNIRHVVLMGKAYEEILRAATEAGSDLIVIGAHKPDLKDHLIGPNASRVVRHTGCSVYVVR